LVEATPKEILFYRDKLHEILENKIMAWAFTTSGRSKLAVRRKQHFSNQQYLWYELDAVGWSSHSRYSTSLAESVW
jgi:hypothetical protein